LISKNFNRRGTNSALSASSSCSIVSTLLIKRDNTEAGDISQSKLLLSLILLLLLLLLFIDYYYKNNGDSLLVEQKHQFLQTKIAILLRYLHMLQPQEAWSCEITDKSELQIEFNKRLWLRTVVKNNKTSMSDIWVPNIDLMISQKVEDNNTEQTDIDTQTSNPLNVFYTIHLLKTMIVLPNTKRLFVNRITGNQIPLSTYTSMMHKEMQKMGIRLNMLL
jgi:hypothetical protein